jgi:alcohol dehydrogenase class IV
MLEFNHYLPTKILFGEGKISELSNLIKGKNSNILIVCGQSAFKTGAFEIVNSILKKSGCKTFLLDKVTTNPTEELILSGVDKLLKNNCETIISIGGGSSHDTAKAISLMSTHEGKLEEYVVTGAKSVGGINNCLIPVITIPTISGTGAEISPAALVRLGKAKSIIYSPYLFPQNTIVDINLLNPKSPDLIVNVGIDAFFQGFEAFVASNSNPFSDKFAISAIKNSINYLPCLRCDPENMKVRAFVAISSIDSLFAVSNSGVGGIHALSDPLSGIYNIPHGIAQSIVAKEVVKHNISSFKDKLPELIALFGIDRNTIVLSNTSEIFLKLFNNFIDSLNISTSFYINKIKEKEINFNQLADDSLNPDMQTNPYKMTREEIISIFKNSLK